LFKVCLSLTSSAQPPASPEVSLIVQLSPLVAAEAVVHRVVAGASAASSASASAKRVVVAAVSAAADDVATPTTTTTASASAKGHLGPASRSFQITDHASLNRKLFITSVFYVQLFLCNVSTSSMVRCATQEIDDRKRVL
jgi:hypothetical protein